ncbi:hypothetical protein B0H13DRAFT_2317672 [Mycena leptocephala]|nr:hypothetical protein B0H13DRAFT_2317672 [Mycena leptocephala]
MSKALALFVLLNAVFASSSLIRAPAAPAIATASDGPSANIVGPVPDAVKVFTTCINNNLGNCLIWSATTLPVGCTDLSANGQAKDVSSVSSVAGVDCTLFASKTCTGKSQFINGTINALTVVGFKDVANSFTCEAH